MTDQTNIEWADSTFNCWLGCTKVSPACDHCYAEKLVDTRMHKAKWGPGQPRVRTSAANWRKPVQWNKHTFIECLDCGWRGDKFIRQAVERHPGCQIYRCPSCKGMHTQFARRRVFCASLADVFDNEVDPQWRRDLFGLIAATPNLDWLLLTKRISNAGRMIDEAIAPALPGEDGPCFAPWPWSNVWLGATICNQEEADRDIPKLLATPATVRFVSIEPMLEAIDLGRAKALPVFKYAEWPIPSYCGLTGRLLGVHPELSGKWSKHDGNMQPWINWVIAGGESGPHARPSHPDWFRSLRDQCAAAGVPFLFKQWGEFKPITTCDGMTDSPFGYDTATGMGFSRVGKKAAGRLLDGVEHSGVPEVRNG